MTDFLAMGGYAFPVWTSYALAVLVLGGLALVSRAAVARSQTTLTLLEQARGRQPRRKAAPQDGAPAQGGAS